MPTNRQSVTYVKLQRLRTYTQFESEFQFRHDRRWHVLQKLCFWVLRKIKAFRLDTIETTVRHPEQNDKLLENMLAQEQWILKELHEQHENYRVYCGPEQSAELWGLINGLGYGHITLDAGIGTEQNGMQMRWHQIPITVVPWMEGAIMVPTRMK